MSYSSQVIARSPLVYWRLGDASGTTMVDSSGNSRNGTYQSSPTLGTTGLLAGDADTAVTFAGSGKQGTIAFASWMNPTTLTVVAWIKLTGGAGTIRGIFGHTDNGTNGPLMFRVNASSKLEMVLWPATAKTLTGSTTLSLNTIYHVACVYDGANMKLYVNGVQDATTTKTGNPSASTALFVGSLGTAGAPFSGVIDEVAYYGSALTATDIANDYTAGSGAFTGGATPALTASVTAAGTVGTATGATRTVTISATAAGILGLSGGATRTLTLSAAAVGTVGHTGGVTGPTVALSVVAAGTVSVGLSGGATPALTLGVVAAGVLARSGGATPALTLGATAVGSLGVSRGATRTVTISVTTAGILGLHGTATPTLSVTAVAVGAATTGGVVTPTLTVSVVAAGAVLTGPGALPVIAVTVEADGVVLVPAETQLIFGIGGRRRNGSADLAWEQAPVAPPWIVTASIRRIAAHIIDSFVVTGPRRSDVQVDFRTLSVDRPEERILVGGHDVTYLRGAPTPTPDLQFVEPGLYGPGTLTLPQIKGGVDHLGSGDLSMFTELARFTYQIKVDGTWTTIYRGFCSDENDSGPDFSINLIGELTGLAGMDYRPPRSLTRVVDLAQLVVGAVRRLRLDAHAPGGGTGVMVVDSGSMSVWDWLSRTFAASTTLGGNQWTIMPDAHGTYRVQRKDSTTVHWTAFLDDARTKGDFRRDYTDEDNEVYGDAVDRNGLRVTGQIIPGIIGSSAAPAYPMSGGASMPPGTTDAETTSGGGVTALMFRLTVLGYLDDEQPTWNDAVTRAVRRAQLRADLDEHGDTVLGTVDPRTWRALWDGDRTGWSMRAARIVPLAQSPKVRRYRTNASGQRIGLNKRFDPRVRRRARYVSFGLVADQGQATDWAQQDLDDGSPDYVGSLTLTMGAVLAGEVNPGDTVTPDRLTDARLCRPNQNVWIPNFRGGTLFHIAGWAMQGGVPQLTLDTRRRDHQEVWQVIDRIRDAKHHVGRIGLASALSSSTTRDQIAVWDRFGGVIDDNHHLTGGQWNIFPVRAGRAGQVERLWIHLVNDPPEFAIAAFGRALTETRLGQIVGNPLTEAGRRNWRRKAETLTQDHYMVYSAGTDQAPLGYHPTSKAEAPGDFPGKTLDEVRTGEFRDDAGFPYRAFGEPVIWLAIYPDRDCVLKAGRLFRVQESDQI